MVILGWLSSAWCQLVEELDCSGGHLEVHIQLMIKYNLQLPLFGDQSWTSPGWSIVLPLDSISVSSSLLLLMENGIQQWLLLPKGTRSLCHVPGHTAAFLNITHNLDTPVAGHFGHHMTVPRLQSTQEDAVTRRLLEKKWIERIRGCGRHVVLNRDDGIAIINFINSSHWDWSFWQYHCC